MRLSRLLLSALFAFASVPSDAEDLARHRIGPWPWASSLVAYRGSLWFASGDRTRDHPSADLYRFDPAEGRVRYERHLFSQGAGRPVVHGGLLYWPLEDPRYGLDVAHVAVTDGRDWRLLTVADEAPLLHATALAADADTLWLNCTSPGLRLFASRDAGAHFAPVGTAPPRDAPLRWILRAETLAGALYGIVIDGLDGATARRTLVRIDSGRPQRVPGLPAAADVIELTVHAGRLLAVVEEAEGRTLWASDGRRSERVARGPSQGRLRDVAVDAAGRLWALTLERRGGLVWRRGEDGAWQLAARVADGAPQELAILGGRPYAVGQAGDGTGALWAPAAPAPVAPREAPAGRLPEPADRARAPWPVLAERARAALARPDAYRDHARAAGEALLALARSDAPPEAFDRLLAGPFPDGSAPMLQARVAVPTQTLGRWLAFWAMAVGGRGRVPVALLGEPWPDHVPGGRSKHFAPLLAALAALGWNGQSDAATLDALVARLDAPGDPAWLRGDVVGALTAATGERHGYDAGAWRRWWKAVRPEWSGR